MKNAILHIPDLMFGMRIADMLQPLGFAPRDLRPREPLADQLRDAALLVLQLKGARETWLPIIEAANQVSVPVLAFGPHVDAETLRAARQAGADKAVPNSQLLTELPQLVAQLVKT